MKNYIFEIINFIKFKFINLKFFSKKNKISLEKNNNYDNIIVKFNRNNIVFDRYTELNKFTNIIKNFLVTLHSNCKNFSPELFLKSFKNTFFRINDLETEQLSSYFTPSINPKVIPHVLRIKNFNASNHELLHQSSTKYINGVLYSGFSKLGDSKYIGNGINEGYTQLLAQKYFNENVGKVYFFEVEIVKILENIVGINKMEKYYFQTGYDSLITELMKYEDYNNIMLFFENVDRINYIKSNNLLEHHFEEFQQLIKNAYDFLFNCFKNKMEMYINSKENCGDDTKSEIEYLFRPDVWAQVYTFCIGDSSKEYRLTTLGIKKYIEYANETQNIFEQSKNK